MNILNTGGKNSSSSSSGGNSSNSNNKNNNNSIIEFNSSYYDYIDDYKTHLENANSLNMSSNNSIAGHSECNTNVSGGNKKKPRDPYAHRRVEKTRRDRMNLSLNKLSSLIPEDFLKQGGTARVDKIRIVDIAITYVEHLKEIIENFNLNKNNIDKNNIINNNNNNNNNNANNEHISSMGSSIFNQNKMDSNESLSQMHADNSNDSDTPSQASRHLDQSIDEKLWYMRGLFNGSIELVSFLIDSLSKMNSTVILDILNIDLFIDILKKFQRIYFKPQKLSDKEISFVIRSFKAKRFPLTNRKLIKKIYQSLNFNYRYDIFGQVSTSTTTGGHLFKKSTKSKKKSFHQRNSESSSGNSSNEIDDMSSSNMKSHSLNDDSSSIITTTHSCGGSTSGISGVSRYTSSSGSTLNPKIYHMPMASNTNLKSTSDQNIQHLHQHHRSQNIGNANLITTPTTLAKQTSEEHLKHQSFVHNSNPTIKNPNQSKLLSDYESLLAQNNASKNNNPPTPAIHRKSTNNNNSNFSSFNTNLLKQSQNLPNVLWSSLSMNDSSSLDQGSMNQTSYLAASASNYTNVSCPNDGYNNNQENNIQNKKDKSSSMCLSINESKAKKLKSNLIERFNDAEAKQIQYLSHLADDFNNSITSMDLSASNSSLFVNNNTNNSIVLDTRHLVNAQNEEYNKTNNVLKNNSAFSFSSKIFRPISFDANAMVRPILKNKQIASSNSKMISIFILHSSHEFYLSACIDESLIDKSILKSIIKNADYKTNAMQRIKLDVAFSSNITIRKSKNNKIKQDMSPDSDKNSNSNNTSNNGSSNNNNNSQTCDDDSPNNSQDSNENYEMASVETNNSNDDSNKNNYLNSNSNSRDENQSLFSNSTSQNLMKRNYGSSMSRYNNNNTSNNYQYQHRKLMPERRAMSVEPNFHF